MRILVLISIFFVFLSGAIFYFFRENILIEKKVLEIKAKEDMSHQARLKEACDEVRREIALKYRNETVAYEMMARRLERAKSEVSKLEGSL